eukprot:2672265-Pyramimonas_sp.AAC.1
MWQGHVGAAGGKVTGWSVCGTRRIRRRRTEGGWGMGGMGDSGDMRKRRRSDIIGNNTRSPTNTHETPDQRP